MLQSLRELVLSAFQALEPEVATLASVVWHGWGGVLLLSRLPCHLMKVEPANLHPGKEIVYVMRVGAIVGPADREQHNTPPGGLHYCCDRDRAAGARHVGFDAEDCYNSRNRLIKSIKITLGVDGAPGRSGSDRMFGVGGQLRGLESAGPCASLLGPEPPGH